MPKFLRRPVEIDAWRFMGPESLHDVPDWIRALERPNGTPRIARSINQGMLEIYTHDGLYCAALGDWIILHPNGFLSVCSHRIFEMTYKAIG